jgi:hypothetical protein
MLKLSLRLLPILLLTWLLVSCRYQPPLAANANYKLRWITPVVGIDTYVRSFERFLEIPGASCQYTLLGWANSNTLYYQTSCPNSTQTTVVAYNVDAQTTVAGLASIPSLFYRINNLDALDHVHLVDFHPSELEAVTRPLFIKSECLTSPDRKYIAIVTRWLYGPEDVMILSQE